MNDTQVLFSRLPGRGGDIGEILLNRPQALNALTQTMCQSIKSELLNWQQDDSIKAVVIRGVGEKAFCAGGDIRAIYDNGPRHVEESLQFFQHEYALNQALFHFSKPFIAFLDGLTMGGGAGISLHGSHPIATERLVFAMPETAIGFFPDIGAGYFLNRCPGKTGYYLGLSGDRIGPADALALGLVKQVIASDNQLGLLDMLCETIFDDKKPKVTVTELINRFAVEPGISKVINHQTMIDDCFGQKTLEQVKEALYQKENQWAEEALARIEEGSPLSMKVTMAMLQRPDCLNFDKDIKMEYNAAAHFLREPDFYEGIRAAVIDKDRRPQWQWPTLAAVSDEKVQSFFVEA